MVSKLIESITGAKANDTDFLVTPIQITSSLIAGHNRPSIDVTLSLEPILAVGTSYPRPSGGATVTFNFGYDADTLAPGTLQYAKNATGVRTGWTWVNLNPSTRIGKDPTTKRAESHRFRIDVTAGDVIQFRQMSGSTVFLQQFLVHLNNEPK